MGIKKFFNKVGDKFKKAGLKILSVVPKFNKVGHAVAKVIEPVLTVAGKFVPPLQPLAMAAKPIAAGADLSVSLTDNLSQKLKSWTDKKLAEIGN